MYRFIFSIFLVCFAAISKAQTIDGKLYTPFNNYYQWIGGKFNSNLNIPKITATTGRDTGGIRYNLIDSSVYVWTGSQWRVVGAPVDTTSLSNRINLKLNISDTAAMLSPYLRSNVAAATYIDSVFIQNDSIKYRKNGVSFASTPADTATVVKAYVTNAEAVTITKGQVVYIFGAQGDRASVKLAKNTSDTFSSKTLGIVRADIAAGQAGWVTTQGQVSGINLGAYTAGDILWLDSVPGGFTKTKPVAPRHSVFVGVVERANVGNGLIYVKPQNGVELSEVHDVLITSPTNNQVLSYTASTGIWENKSATAALGYTPLDSVLNIAGSGVALVKGNDQIKRLKAGSGITITDNTDSVTIASSATSSGVAWTGVDSLFAATQAEKGFHHVEDFNAPNQAGGVPVGSAYTYITGGGGNPNGSFEGGVSFLRASTGTSASSAPTTNYSGNVGGTALYIPGSDYIVWQCRIRLPILNDGTQRYYFQAGFFSAGVNSPFNSMYLTYDLNGTAPGSAASANWQAVTSGALNRTYTTTSVAVSANTWIKLRIVVNNTQVLFYIDGNLVATHTTNIGNDIIYPTFRMIKTNGTTARNYDMDYSTIDIKYSTSR